MPSSASEFCSKGKASINEKAYAESLSRDAMYKDGWWLQYCFCGGRLIGNLGNPFIGSEVKQLCQHQTCELTGLMDPNLCNAHEVCLCVTSDCGIPPREGSPTCVCFNKKLAGGDTGGWKPSLFEFTNGFDKQFWIYYILCLGCSVHGIGKDERPLCAYDRKEFCIRMRCQFVPPYEEKTLCASVGTCLCYWDQCQFPPYGNNPKFALCGWKLNKGEAATGNVAPMSYGKPAQNEMS